LIPKFVIEWMKETGPPYFRRVGTPNLRMQDGPKERLLCADCEQRISKDERLFAERAFRPFLTQPNQPVAYDAFLMRFLISMVWRRLVSPSDTPPVHRHFDEQLLEAQEEWRCFLLGKSELTKYCRVHLFLTDILAQREQPVRSLNQYLARAIDGCVVTSNTACAVYVKFARFIIWAEITEFNPADWENTRVANGPGVLNVPQGIRDGNFGDFLLHRTKQASEAYWKRISKRQQAIIEKRFVEEASSLRGTDFWRALEADMEARVDPHPWIHRKIGRNELCPCGSGKKYKRCHGDGGGSGEL
jgi:hypothetical protein